MSFGNVSPSRSRTDDKIARCIGVHAVYPASSSGKGRHEVAAVMNGTPRPPHKEVHGRREDKTSPYPVIVEVHPNQDSITNVILDSPRGGCHRHRVQARTFR